MWLPFISALLLLSLPTGKTLAVEEIRVASDNWCPYICAGKDGIDGDYLVDLAAETLALAHITVRPVLMPWSRAVAATEPAHWRACTRPPPTGACAAAYR